MTLETARLRIRQLTPDDAAFILTLLNDPGFLRYIGDKGVRSLEDARQYIEHGPRASYARHGFGLNAVEPIDGGDPVGICGILKRDELDAPDLGFAFLPLARGQGLAREAASAILDDAWARLGVTRMLAITQPENYASVTLLERLGFRFDRMVRLAPEGHDLRLFSRAL